MHSGSYSLIPKLPTWNAPNSKNRPWACHLWLHQDGTQHGHIRFTNATHQKSNALCEFPNLHSASQCITVWHIGTVCNLLQHVAVLPDMIRAKYAANFQHKCEKLCDKKCKTGLNGCSSFSKCTLCTTNTKPPQCLLTHSCKWLASLEISEQGLSGQLHQMQTMSLVFYCQWSLLVVWPPTLPWHYSLCFFQNLQCLSLSLFTCHLEQPKTSPLGIAV